MATETNRDAAGELPHWAVLALWIAASLMLAIVLARIAVWLQGAGAGAVIVFPALLGLVLGLAIGAAANLLGLNGRALLAAMAMISAAVLAAAEHGFFYLDYRSRFAAKFESELAGNPLLAALSTGPASLREFMAAEAPGRWPLWILDAVTMIAVAGVAAFLITRRAPLSDRG